MKCNVKRKSEFYTCKYTIDNKKEQNTNTRVAYKVLLDGM